MAGAVVTFKECIQNMQELGSNDEYMFSNLYFSITVDGKVYDNLECTIKQTAGSDFENDKMIEVFVPETPNIKFSYVNFSKAAKLYYLSLVGSSGSGIRISNCSNIKMFNNRFKVERSYPI